jgi:hypothetical protein
LPSVSHSTLIAVSDSGDQAVHELPALRKITIAKPKKMMTSDYDPPTRPAFE